MEFIKYFTVITFLFFNFLVKANGCEYYNQVGAMDGNTKSFNSDNSAILYSKLQKFKRKDYRRYNFEYLDANFEIAIHSSCKESFSELIQSFIKMFDNELNCLGNLGEAGRRRRQGLLKILTKENQIGTRFNQLQSLEYKLFPIDYKPLTINCFNSRNELGAFGAASSITAPDFPHLDLVRLGDGSFSTVTLFHEMLHLLGYTHSGNTTEMAYACEFSCSSMKNFLGKDPSIKAAKNICENEFQVGSENYIKNFFPLRNGNGLNRAIRTPWICHSSEICDKYKDITFEELMKSPPAYLQGQ